MECLAARLSNYNNTPSKKTLGSGNELKQGLSENSGEGESIGTLVSANLERADMTKDNQDRIFSSIGILDCVV